jgi:curli biogenesis system outer membrane secretion channel CsgG
MKKFIFLFIILNLLNPIKINAQGSSFTIEKAREHCKGTPRDKRVRITVTRFSVSSNAAKASGQFGEELTAIMTNALQETNCFRVLESTKNKEDLNDELGYNESGATNGSGPKRGKQFGAQAIVTAEITEYNDGNSSVTFAGLSVGSSKAKIGVIVKVIDPETRDILWSKSINGEGKKGGFSGVSIIGIHFAGANKVSEAMSAAVEDLMLKTVELMVNEKESIFSDITNNQDLVGSQKQWNKDNCSLLQSSRIPKIMVIVPEYHIQSPIPDPAGETEIIRKMLEAGFRVIDPSMFATLRNGAKFKEAVKDPMSAISLGKEFGADIVIFGEGFSQRAGTENKTVTCRARVEVKAVRTDNAEIIATNGAQAGGQDIAESTSAKTALTNAGSQIADYLLGQFCSKNLRFNH